MSSTKRGLMAVAALAALCAAQSGAPAGACSQPGAQLTFVVQCVLTPCLRACCPARPSRPAPPVQAAHRRAAHRADQHHAGGRPRLRCGDPVAQGVPHRVPAVQVNSVSGVPLPGGVNNYQVAAAALARPAGVLA